MSKRNTVIQALYEKISNDDLSKEMNDALIEAIDFSGKYLSEEVHDNMKDKLCKLEHTAFCEGANCILDFIAERNVGSNMESDIPISLGVVRW